MSEGAILAAHAQADAGTLCDLYARAADRMAPDEAAFFLTQAWIFALEAGDARAGTLEARLVAMGRV
jgi:hypothetical protein